MQKITARLSNQEYLEIQEFCERTERTQNDVVRESIRRFLDEEATRRNLRDPQQDER
jgi:Arc/MetJ-type ribon-helix-helix transcriptional regulator